MPPSRLLDATDTERFTPPELDVETVQAKGDPAQEARIAERRVAEATKAGFAEGLARGRQEGQAAFERERAEAAARLSDALGRLHRLEAKIVEDAKRELVDLGLTIASRILRAKLEADDPVAVRVLDDLLESLGPGSGRKVRLHPLDYQAVLAHRAELAEEATIELVADESIERGGLVVECGDQDVDARVATSLEMFRDVLEGAE